MNKLLIVGAGGLGRMTMESARTKYECYFIDDNISKDTFICDTKVVGKISDLEKLRSEYENLIVSIGNNQIRENITNNAIELGYKIPNIFNETAYISPYVKFGYGCIVLSNASIQNGAVLHNGVVITANVEIHHDCELDDYSLVYSNSTIRTNAYVGKRVKIGSNCCISNNRIVNEDTIIENGNFI